MFRRRTRQRRRRRGDRSSRDVGVDRGCARVRVAGGELHVTQRHPCIEGSHDERSSEHVRMHVTESGSFADRLHPPMCGATVETLTVVAHQDRLFTPLADREIDGASGTWDERNHCRLVAFAEDPEGAVAAVEAQVADVGLAGFADPQPIEPEQHRESGALVPALFCCEQEPAEFGAVHPVALARMHLRAADVLCRVRPDPAVDVRKAVQPAHRRKAPIDRRGGEPSLFHVMPEQLDVRARATLGRVREGDTWTCVQMPDSAIVFGTPVHLCTTLSRSSSTTTSPTSLACCAVTSDDRLGSSALVPVVRSRSILLSTRRRRGAWSHRSSSSRNPGAAADACLGRRG